MVAPYEKVILRKVDIQNWNSKAAARARGEFGLSAIPLTAVFDSDGAFIDSVVGAKPADIEALLRDAGAK